jgi:hypothetical protein
LVGPQAPCVKALTQAGAPPSATGFSPEWMEANPA